LGRSDLPEPILYARKPRQLPLVLSAGEVVRLLDAVANLNHRRALTTAYAAGPRAAEMVWLKLADIDSSRMVLRVVHGKRGKDRYVMLSRNCSASCATTGGCGANPLAGPRP
jgi:site-specific recombinase XerD